ncbi:GNAT family N-acetyltransferase [Streptomyces sp. 4N509B]|uniref:GNAT family N-acetyltransferase n=1 Tax=Streptomyces sp. 4N509B TaxID=3457413 RepID=UPI003FD16879
MFIEERSPDDPELAWLLHAAFAELVARAGARGRSGVRREARYLVAVAEERAVGCVALQPVPEEATTGEVKRMYVTPAARGRGMARGLLTAVERLAPELGYHRLRLVTGVGHVAAVALYESAGYVRTAPYGRYVTEAGNVVCFAKSLSPGASAAPGASARPSALSQSG